MSSITVRITENYGVEAIYPDDEQSRLFTRLTGKKTLSRSDIKIIESLGFEVKVQQASL